MAQGMSTMHTYLMYGEGSDDSITWKKLCNIKDYPDLVGRPEQVEITDLSDEERTYTPGLKTNEEKTFNANYWPSDYDTIEAMEGTEMPLAVWFGANDDGTTPDGHDGKFEGRGKVSVSVSGAGVGDPNNMAVTCTLNKGFKKVKSSTLGG